MLWAVRQWPLDSSGLIDHLVVANARNFAGLIARELLSDYPLVREWAKRALESILGRCDVDLGADDATIAQQGASCAGAPMAPAGAAPHDEDPED